ncbi:hypothetical protein NQ318_003489, partial [Aromia moschata]
YNGEYFQQHEGTAMDNSLSPFIAKLFMSKFETEANDKFEYFPRVWFKYVDDIFAFLNVVEVKEIMTHYWWMHWFWITLWVSIHCCEDTLTTSHSNSTDLSASNVSNGSYGPTKSTETPGSPPTTIYPIVTAKNITTPKNNLINKIRQAFLQENRPSVMVIERDHQEYNKGN